MAGIDPRDRSKPEWPAKDWEDDYDEMYREPQEQQTPERQRSSEPGEPGVRREEPDRSREHSPDPNAR
jgi:hypothetical protein